MRTRFFPMFPAFLTLMLTLNGCAGETGESTATTGQDGGAAADAGTGAGQPDIESADVGTTGHADAGQAVAKNAYYGPEVLQDTNPADGIVEVKITAAVQKLKLFDDLPELEMYLYNGQFPGPTLRARVGDKVIVHFTNNLTEPTTIHWHGLRIPDTMDGNPRIQQPVKPGETFKYEFTVPDAGTYWYHPHMRSNEQVEKGLYGGIIIDEPKVPVVDTERLFIMDDIRVGNDGKWPAFLASHPEQMHGRTGNRLLINGSGKVAEIATKRAKLERWRIVNTANARTMHFDIDGDVLIRVVGVDGGLLEKPFILDKPLTVPVGQRYDLEVLYGAVGVATLRSHVPVVVGNKVQYQPYAQAKVTVADDPNAPRTYTSPFPGGEAIPVRSVTQKREIAFKAVQSNISPTGVAWLINDKAYWKDAPLFTFEEGDVVLFTIKNLAGPEHPFHLHGQFFEIVDPEDQPGLKDTVLVPGMSTVKIRAYMDNPGKWMAHCHILGHAEQGMMSEIVVTPKSK